MRAPVRSRPMGAVLLVAAVLLVGCVPDRAVDRAVGGDDADVGPATMEPGAGAPARGEAGPTGEAAAAVDDGVLIEPGDDWRDVVAQHPPGTTFIIGTGLHRRAAVGARDGDRFFGQPGAVLNGADVLEDWRAEGDVWVHDRLELVEEYVGELDEGFEREGLRHDLFVDGGFMRHVGSEEEVGVGSWFYDVEGDRAVLGEDPGGRLVEIGMDFSAISTFDLTDRTRDVHIADLEFEHYAPYAQFGAINGVRSVDWTIERVHVRANHGAGIRIGGGMVVRDSVVVGNGQIGITGAADAASDRPVQLIGNEIRENGRLGFTWFWEKGGIKLVGTTDAVVRDNLVVANLGPGIWFDIENEGALITGNQVDRNSIIGVFYELSSDALIEGNLITGNGWDAGPRLAAGISISNAGRVRSRGNVLRGNTNEYVVVYTDRDNLGTMPTDMVVEGNDITIDRGFVGVSILTDDTDLYDPDVQLFRDNDYRLERCDPCFFWDDRIPTEEWRALGLDADSRFEDGS